MGIGHQVPAESELQRHHWARTDRRHSRIWGLNSRGARIVDLMTTPPRTRPRTLADALRGWDDAALGRLVRHRPDLARPMPSDTGQLAARATSHASAARAVNRLDEFAVDLLEALSALPEPVDLAALCRGVDQPTELVEPRLAELRELALAWGPDDDLRTIRAVHELLGPTPAGLGPLTTRHFGDLDKLIEESGPDARTVLDRLAWGPPTGQVEKADRGVTIASAKSPIEHLLARGLLTVKDSHTVVLPRQIGLHLRGGRVHPSTRPAPPPQSGRKVSATISERAAAGAALELVRQVDRLLESIGAVPPPVLRTGGLGIRELRTVADRAGLDEQDAAIRLELAYAAGMLTEVEVGTRDLWVPTKMYDEWLELDTSHRWARLVAAWRVGLRAIGLVGRRDDRDRPVNALSADLERLLAPEIRELTLRALAEAGPELAPDEDSVVSWVGWHRPRRGGTFRDDLVRWTLAEAATLGLTGLGSMPAYVGSVVAGEDTADALAPHVPEPVDHVLLQADLTAVAPGTLVREVYTELSAMADPESHGAGGVFRFSDASIRRALDLGRTAEQLHAWLAEHSRTPVPQPLEYLVDDVARRHGVLRIGAASTYLRCDDEAVLTGVLNAGLPGVQFRRLAATVLVSPAPPDVLLERLRDAGLAPLAESFDGVVQLAVAPSRRAEPPRRRTSRDLAESVADLSDDQVRSVVAAVRAGDRLADERPAERTDRPGQPELSTATAPLATIGLLTDAADAKLRTFISYVDHNGVASERIVEPVRVADGWLTAYDTSEQGIGQPRTYALHRIAMARILEETSE